MGLARFIELSDGFSEGFASQITGNVATLTGTPPARSSSSRATTRASSGAQRSPDVVRRVGPAFADPVRSVRSAGVREVIVKLTEAPR